MINRTTMRLGAAYEGIQRGVLPVYQSGVETGNKEILMDHPMRDLFVANDSETYNVAIVVTGDADLNLEFLLYPGETLNERMPEFTKVTVTATEEWRWYVRSGRVT